MRKNRHRKQAEQQEPQQSGTAVNALARAFDIPPGILSGFSQISLSGNREAVVEGCAGVLEYDNTLIKLNLNKMMVQFTGRDLQLKCMTGESVIIAGYIADIEFLA